VAFGPTADVFTPQNLQTTYGGRLNILSDVVQVIGQGRESGEKVENRKLNT
jgi:hypothetical protein